MKLRTLGALAAVSAIALSACNQTPGGSGAPASGASGAKPAVCENKKGASSTEIHVYSSLPRQGTNTEQTNTLVEQIRNTLEGKKVGNFTIKYTDLDDSSAAQGGDWDGAVEQSNANKVAADPDAMDRAGEIAFLDGRHAEAARWFGQEVRAARSVHGGWTAQ